MNNNIIDLFCKSDTREVICKDDTLYFFLSLFTSFKAFKDYTNNLI